METSSLPLNPSEAIPLLDPGLHNALLAAIVDSSDDAIISKNLKGIVTSWNQSARRIFGYTAQEMIGKPITTLIPPERQDEEPKILSMLVRGQRVEHFETIRVTKSGERIHISLTISPIKDKNGVIVGASKVARDITERRRAELLIQQSLAEAHEANRAKDNFLAALSHELRTPLMPALMTVSVIRQQHPNMSDTLARQLATIEKNLRTETKLIDGLLDLSKITRRKEIEIESEPVDLHLVLEEALNTSEWLQNEKRLIVKRSLGAKRSIVLGDVLRLEQIFWNLLTNATKFTPADGKIEVSTEEEGDTILVTIQDTGIGFDCGSHELFRPFHQKAPQFGGLGMGLPIAKAFVELHKGSIELCSPGLSQGVCVRVRLPLKK